MVKAFNAELRQTISYKPVHKKLKRLLREDTIIIGHKSMRNNNQMIDAHFKKLSY